MNSDLCPLYRRFKLETPISIAAHLPELYKTLNANPVALLIAKIWTEKRTNIHIETPITGAPLIAVLIECQVEQADREQRTEKLITEVPLIVVLM